MRRNLDIDLLRSFVALAEAESFTRAAAGLGRTQSAVSMQLKRLEDGLQRRLVERDTRKLRLTRDGEALLGYARRILRINDEAVAHFAEPALDGVVRLGTPDDYASHLLPGVLAGFTRQHPRVRVEVSCANGLDLLPQLREDGLDLALVTQHARMPAGETVRRERLRWVGAARSAPTAEDPLPLALYSEGCVCRAIALAALDAAGRRWRIAYSSRSISVLQSAVLEGIALSVMEHSIVPDGARVLGEADGLPSLPEVEVTLHRRAGPASRAADHLARHIVAGLRDAA